jgi:lipopolysaccharide transport system permease protein
MRDTVVIVEPGRQARHYWVELLRYRELFFVLAWRDLSIRYKQTAIGVAWAVIRPVLTALVLTIVFGHIAKLPSENSTPYIVLVLAGMLPWTFFSTSLGEASNSLVSNTNLISKVYFPRLIIPAATIGVAFVDFFISFCILLALMGWYGILPTWHIALLPLFIFLTVFASLGPALWTTALTVKYRDFRYVTPFMIQLGLYASPIGFSSAVVPERWRLLYSLNPLVGIIDGFRWCLLAGNTQLYLPGLAVGIAVIGFLFLFGVHRFRSMERSFADLI